MRIQVSPCFIDEVEMRPVRMCQDEVIYVRLMDENGNEEDKDRAMAIRGFEADEDGIVTILKMEEYMSVNNGGRMIKSGYIRDIQPSDIISWNKSQQRAGTKKRRTGAKKSTATKKRRTAAKKSTKTKKTGGAKKKTSETKKRRTVAKKSTRTKKRRSA